MIENDENTGNLRTLYWYTCPSKMQGQRSSQRKLQVLKIKLLKKNGDCVHGTQIYDGPTSIYCYKGS